MYQASHAVAAPVDTELPPDIHVVVDGADVGPLEGPALRQLFLDGKIGPSTLAWHPALDAWAEIGQMPELAAIVVPPPPVVAEPPAPALAPLAPRLFAGAVDLAIWLALLVLIALPLGFAPLLEGVEDSDLAGRFDILAQLLSALYFILPMSVIGGGATPGYRLFGLRLVAANTNEPPGVIRTLVWYMVTYLDLVGWLAYFFDPKRRMLHNIASNTLVISIRPSQTSGA